VTEPWKRRVEQRLAELGRDKVWLGTETGGSKQGIQTMLAPQTRSSRLVPAVHKALGWAAPTTPTPEAQLAGITQEEWDSLPEHARETIRGIIRQYRRDT
jgi:hypothetical protein